MDLTNYDDGSSYQGEWQEIGSAEASWWMDKHHWQLDSTENQEHPSYECRLESTQWRMDFIGAQEHEKDVVHLSGMGCWSEWLGGSGTNRRRHASPGIFSMQKVEGCATGCSGNGLGQDLAVGMA